MSGPSTTTDHLYAMFKFDDRVLVFRNTLYGKLQAAQFAAMSSEDRLEFARMFRENWKPEDLAMEDVLIGLTDSLPASIPSGLLIGLAGAGPEAFQGAPLLDPDGYPEDPAAAMPVYARAAKC